MRIKLRSVSTASVIAATVLASGGALADPVVSGSSLKTGYPARTHVEDTRHETGDRLTNFAAGRATIASDASEEGAPAYRHAPTRFERPGYEGVTVSGSSLK